MNDNNVKYCIEVKDLHGSGWEVITCHTNLQDATYGIEGWRKDLPKQTFRLIRCEWTVID